MTNKILFLLRMICRVVTFLSKLCRFLNGQLPEKKPENPDQPQEEKPQHQSTSEQQ